jgi:DNA-binding MarR family transcriptional regulator
MTSPAEAIALLGILTTVERRVETSELTVALRDIVIATERFRLRVARQVFGMGATEMLALGGLAVDGPSTPTAIAERLQITTPSVTELVDRLERNGLARRRPHETDRRKVLVELTDAGLGKAAAVTGRFAEALARSAAGLDDDELHLVLSFLRRATVEVNSVI